MGSPYVVTGDLYVNNGQTLTIEPGVEVRFYGDYFFYVYGSFIAEGTEEDSIYFQNHIEMTQILMVIGRFILLMLGNNRIKLLCRMLV